MIRMNLEMACGAINESSYTRRCYLLVAAIIEELALLDCMTDQGRYYLIARGPMIDVPKLEVLRDHEFWLRGQTALTQGMLVHISD